MYPFGDLLPRMTSMTHISKSPVFLIEQVLLEAAEPRIDPTSSVSEPPQSCQENVSSSSIRDHSTSPSKVRVYTTAFLVHQGRGWNKASHWGP